MGCSSMIPLAYLYLEQDICSRLIIYSSSKHIISFKHSLHVGIFAVVPWKTFFYSSPTFNTFTILALNTYSTAFDDD